MMAFKLKRRQASRSKKVFRAALTMITRLRIPWLSRCQGIENCKLALSQAYSTISVRWVASLVLWVPLAQRLSLSSNTGEPACLSWVQWSLQIRNLIKRPLQTIQRSITSSGAAPRLAILTARLGARVDSSRSSALVWDWIKKTECSTRTTWCSSRKRCMWPT